MHMTQFYYITGYYTGVQRHAYPVFHNKNVAGTKVLSIITYIWHNPRCRDMAKKFNSTSVPPGYEFVWRLQIFFD